MSDCITTCQPQPKRNTHRCPANGIEYNPVPIRTVLHHILQPWHWQDRQQSYYFCDDPDCDVVYFGDDDSTIARHRLRTAVGVKERRDSSILCYCFGVTFEDARYNKQVKTFVIDQTRQQLCACEVRNPSGRCCLQNFPNS